MELNQQGQLFFLDFLISVGVVFLAVALIVQQTESYSYSAKQYQQQIELQSIGRNAFNALTLDSNIVCTLVTDDGTDSDIKIGSDDPVIGPMPFCLTVSRNLPGNANPKGNAYGYWKNRQGNPLFKEELGIPDDFQCEITTSLQATGILSDKRMITDCCTLNTPNPLIQSIVGNPNNCNSVFTTQNAFSQTAKIVFYNNPDGAFNKVGDSTITKAQLDACMGFEQSTGVNGSAPNNTIAPITSKKCYPKALLSDPNTIIALYDANITLKVWKP